MARKKASKSAGNGILIVFAVLIAAVASIPKNAWIAIGVVVSIAGIMWLLARRAAHRRALAEAQLDAIATKERQQAQEAVRARRARTPEILPPLRNVPTSVASPLANTSATNDKVDQGEKDFFTVKLGLTETRSFRIPAPDPKRTEARWVPCCEQVDVGEFSIPGGMLYIGNFLGGYDAQEPSLINPQLRVARTYVDLQERLMPYWPSYHSITPEARRGYLQWLAGGRCDSEADTGYVFLFFYGLERRALLDAQTDPTAAADIPLIIEEIKRLLGIYEESRSFRSYATGLLSHIDGTAFDSEAYLGEPPLVVPNGYEMPLSLRIGLGQHAAKKHPLNADWALAWALADPNIGKRTPVTRCGEVFATLFKAKYEASHPTGIVLAQNKTKLKASYRPASAVLRLPATAIGDLPDVMATSGSRKILHYLVEVCTSELEPYSRYLGRNPDGANTLDGLLQLPPTLWPSSARAELDDLQARISNDSIVMSFGELAGRFKSAGALSRDKTLALARALESRHIGMEPDVLAGSRTPKAEDKIALFVTQPEDGTLRATPAYGAASVTLDLASAVASADGDTSMEEVSLLSSHIDSWNHLSVAHQKRLKAHLQIQLQQPPTLASLRKKLDPLPSEAKRTIASFLAHLAQADGVVSPSEVKLLERVYKALQLDSQLLYSDLHGAAAGGTAATVSSTSLPNRAAEGQSQPASTTTAGFTLDHDRIAQLQQETAAVSALLAQVFTDEELPAQSSSGTYAGIASEAQNAQQDNNQADLAHTDSQSAEAISSDIPGLDLEHSAFLRLLVSRAEWSRTELEAAASDMELMLDGALEQINDMAFDRFNMPVTEGDDPVEINADILEELAL